MNLKKNFAAKVGALVASVAALLGTWALVHQNPPQSTSAATAVPQATPARSSNRTTSRAPAVQATRHTRTHVS